ncbi:MAG: hypothetical protein ACUZ8E_09215 [Candidatus Anammoxibacter sp.]
MASYFVAVGGTGQNVALTYIRLSRLCGFSETEIYLMDMDQSGGLAKELSLSSVGREDAIPLIKFNSSIVGKLGTKDFSHIFEDPHYPDIPDVLKVLFKNRHLQTPINAGIFARPSVGASALALKFDRIAKGLEEDEVLDEFILKLTEKDTVVICGSIFGGTGAGGVPTLAEYINKRRPGIRIIIIDLLKWFRINNPSTQLKETEEFTKYVEEDEIVEDDIRKDVNGKDQENGDDIINKTIENNSQAGLLYLEDRIAKNVEACVLLGHQTPSSYNYEKINEQTEKSSFMTLVAAVITNNSFCDDKLYPNSNRIYNYIIDEGIIRSSSLEVFLSMNKKLTVDKVIQLNNAVCDFLVRFQKYLEESLPGFCFFPSIVVPNNLKRIIAKIEYVTGKDERNICDALSVSLKTERDEIESLKNRFVEFGKRNESQSDSILEITDDKLTSRRLRKRLKRPMSLIRKCINKINIDDLVKNTNGSKNVDRYGKEFKIQLVNNLRDELVKLFF